MPLRDLVPDAYQERDLDSVVARPMNARQLIAMDVAVSVVYTAVLLATAIQPGRPAVPRVPLSVAIPLTLLIGLTPAGSGQPGVAPAFTPDLDVPIRSTSFQYAIPGFGGYPNNPGFNGGLSVTDNPSDWFMPLFFGVSAAADD